MRMPPVLPAGAQCQYLRDVAHTSEKKARTVGASRAISANSSSDTFMFHAVDSQRAIEGQPDRGRCITAGLHRRLHAAHIPLTVGIVAHHCAVKLRQGAQRLGKREFGIS